MISRKEYYKMPTLTEKDILKSVTRDDNLTFLGLLSYIEIFPDNWWSTVGASSVVFP